MWYKASFPIDKVGVSFYNSHKPTGQKGNGLQQREGRRCYDPVLAAARSKRRAGFCAMYAGTNVTVQNRSILKTIHCKESELL